jgi:signal transduction histidine kinase
MKSKKSDSSGKSTAFSDERDLLNGIFREILPVIFHKLKNKLTPILGYTQILKARAADDFSRERLDKIENSASELSALLTNLKDYLKVEAPALQPGNLNRILKELEPAWQKTAAEQQVKFFLDLDAAIPEMQLHPGQMRLLLLNLTANAFSALRTDPAPGKEIRLTTRREDDRVTLIVRDNGIGMSPEERDNIWTPFYAKFKNGTGMGLVICEKVIANHGAACQVSSQPGAYSEFVIAFPLPEKSAAKHGKSAATDSPDDK